MEWKQLLNSDRIEGTSQTSPDHREQFERDYDRTVFSTPVRRMQDKTQVFPLDPNDSVRTRLTHSLEVSTIARGLARSTCLGLAKGDKIQLGMDRQIEAIAATCGLLHDLGNPPFGHAGETAIREWFNQRLKEDGDLNVLHEGSQYRQDFALFQGNGQTIRLITKLQVLANRAGLNLTFGTISAAIKYVSPSHEVKKHPGHIHKDLGFFASENDIINQVRSVTGTGSARNPITFLVEAADDLAYTVVDLEDGISKGILTWEKLKDELTARLEGNQKLLGEAIDSTRRVLRLDSGGKKDVPCQSYGRAFRTAVIGIAVRAVTEKFLEEHDKILRGEYVEEIVYQSSAADLVSACKNIGREYVYLTPANVKLELMGRKIIKDLLTFFWEGAKQYDVGADKKRNFPGKIAAMLSENYKQVFKDAREKSSALPIEYLRLQLVTDYVCGMTDSFALNLHQELRL